MCLGWWKCHESCFIKRTIDWNQIHLSPYHSRHNAVKLTGLLIREVFVLIKMPRQFIQQMLALKRSESLLRRRRCQKWWPWLRSDTGNVPFVLTPWPQRIAMLAPAGLRPHAFLMTDPRYFFCSTVLAPAQWKLSVQMMTTVRGDDVI